MTHGQAYMDALRRPVEASNHVDQEQGRHLVDLLDGRDGSGDIERRLEESLNQPVEFQLPGAGLRRASDCLDSSAMMHDLNLMV